MSWSDLWKLIAADDARHAAGKPPLAPPHSGPEETEAAGALSSGGVDSAPALTPEQQYDVFVDALRVVLDWAEFIQSCLRCGSGRTTMTSYARMEEEPTLRITATCMDCEHMYALQVDDISFVAMYAMDGFDKAKLWSEIDMVSLSDEIALEDDVDENRDYSGDS